DTSRQTKNLNKLLIRILLHLQVEFSSENRIGIVETDEGKFIAIDHTGKKLFEIMFQSPVLSVEDLFRYGYFIYVTRNGRQGVATISGLRYTQPTHKPIDLSDVDRDVIKALIH
uniref:hypothetical protein n=1 Tax=uncultured Alistipes sp. TaxID=538949 RepID=UPI0025930A42